MYMSMGRTKAAFFPEPARQGESLFCTDTIGSWIWTRLLEHDAMQVGMREKQYRSEKKVASTCVRGAASRCRPSWLEQRRLSFLNLQTNSRYSSLWLFKHAAFKRQRGRGAVQLWEERSSEMYEHGEAKRRQSSKICRPPTESIALTSHDRERAFSHDLCDATPSLRCVPTRTANKQEVY
jgi:hypothetical protein